MTEINTSEILNQVDQKYFTLYVEWFDSGFKIMLLESTKIPLSGEMSAEDIDMFCDQLSMPRSEYIQETKDILCGRSETIQFCIEDNLFQWKKGVWIRGKIKLNPVSDMQVVSETLKKSLKFYHNIQEKANKLEEENRSLMDAKNKLSLDIEKMIEIKSGMEQDLYKKFLLILNSKKKKLKELEGAMQGKQESKESVFNACTDESEGSQEENETSNSPTKRTVPKKRKLPANSNSNVIKNIRKESTNINANHGNDETLKLSTEKVVNSKSPSCAPESKNSKDSLNFKEESEDELFSE